MTVIIGFGTSILHQLLLLEFMSFLLFFQGETAALCLSIWMSEFLTALCLGERLSLSSRGFLLPVEVVVRS